MPNGVDTRHPDYVDRETEWQLMRDTARGEEAVKARDYSSEYSAYLPMPSGFAKQPDKGRALYAAYQKRAEVPEIVMPTVSGMVGVIHRKEAKIEMPDAMLGLWEQATPDGLPLEAFHRRITSELLTTGRYGLLADASPEGSDLPWLAGYSAEALINWSEDRDFFVLDESGIVRQGFEWVDAKAYRVLTLEEGKYTVQAYDDGNPVNDGAFVPTVRGGKALAEIPFVVIGAKDLAVAPEDPPLIGVARSVIAQYQLSADYRFQLFMSGQETLVVIGGPAPEAVGAGVCIELPGEPGFTADAKYIGPSGVTIAAHRTAIQDAREAAIAAGARLFDSTGKTAESGEALKIRYAAQTATLVSIAQASAAGLEKALRYVAIMIGADPEQVVVTPDLSFLQSALNPQDAKALMELWTGNAISYETLYENLARGQIASAERDAEAELALIDKENVNMGPDQMGFVPVQQVAA